MTARIELSDTTLRVEVELVVEVDDPVAVIAQVRQVIARQAGSA